MSTSPVQNDLSYYFVSSPDYQTDAAAFSKSSHTGISPGTPSILSPPTQYEFIMSNGYETTTSARKKLKTVRSHVMKNYLHQKLQKRGSQHTSISCTNERRRKVKQWSRSSQSSSENGGQSPRSSDSECQSAVGASTLITGLSLADPFTFYGEDRSSHLSECTSRRTCRKPF
jgi:hypothetical protein